MSRELTSFNPPDRVLDQLAQNACTMLSVLEVKKEISAGTRVSTYADHMPLYRQSEIYPRHGMELGRSTLADIVRPEDTPLAEIYQCDQRDLSSS